ncbi:hypothetical protein DFH11DRAFT_1834073 [Phellopilus nigrolimitatus]|nr:hypothetical protein DFH11DRAFT_1834073 [Phellopilus nigrolimitatus]
MALEVSMNIQHHPPPDYREQYPTYAWSDASSATSSGGVYVADANEPANALYTASSSSSQPDTYGSFMSPPQLSQAQAQGVQPSSAMYQSVQISNNVQAQRSASSLQYALRPSAHQSPLSALSFGNYEMGASGSSSSRSFAQGPFSSVGMMNTSHSLPHSNAHNHPAKSWPDNLFTIEDTTSHFREGSSDSDPHSPDPARRGSNNYGSRPMAGTSAAAAGLSPASHNYHNYPNSRHVVKADPDESDLNARFILEHPAFPPVPHTVVLSAPVSSGDGTVSPSLPSSPFMGSVSFGLGDADTEPHLPHSLTAPLRAVNASKEMRALMGVFRLDPFTTLNGMPTKGLGGGSATWDGGEAGPLEYEPIMLEFQLYIEGMELEDVEDGDGPENAMDGDQDTVSGSEDGADARMYGGDYAEISRIRRAAEQEDEKYEALPVSTRSIFDRYLEQQRVERRMGSSSYSTATSGLRIPERTDAYSSGGGNSVASFAIRIDDVFLDAFTPSLRLPDHPPRALAALRAMSSHTQAQQSLALYRVGAGAGAENVTFTPTPASVAAEMHMLASRAQGQGQSQSRMRAGAPAAHELVGPASVSTSGSLSPVSGPAHQGPPAGGGQGYPLHPHAPAAFDGSALPRTMYADYQGAGGHLVHDNTTYALAGASIAGASIAGALGSPSSEHSQAMSRRWSDASRVQG